MKIPKKTVNTLFDLRVVQDDKIAITVNPEGLIFKTRQGDIVYTESKTDVSKPIRVDFKSLAVARKTSSKYRKAVSGYEFHDNKIVLDDEEKRDEVSSKIITDNIVDFKTVDKSAAQEVISGLDINSVSSYIFDSTSNEKGELFKNFQRPWLVADSENLMLVSSNGMTKHYAIIGNSQSEFKFPLSEVQEKIIKDLSRDLPSVSLYIFKDSLLFEFNKDVSTIYVSLKMDNENQPKWLDAPSNLDDYDEAHVYIEQDMVESLGSTEVRQYLQVRSTSARHTIGFILEDGIVYRFQKNPESKRVFLSDEVDEDTSVDPDYIEEDIESLFDLNHHEAFCSYETDEYIDASLVIHHGAMKHLLDEEGILTVSVLDDEVVVKNKNLLYVIKRVDYS